MEFAKKMVLVPKERYAHHMASDDQLSDMDKALKKILFSKESDDVKMKLYLQVLQKRLDIDAFNPPVIIERKNASSVPIDEPIQNMEEERVPKKEIMTIKKEKKSFDDVIVNSVPKSLRGTTQNIIDFTKLHSNIISWTPKGEFMYKRKVMPTSNIVDLIDNLVRNRKSLKYLPASQEFISALREINLPLNYIKNKNIVSQIGRVLPAVKWESY